MTTVINTDWAYQGLPLVRLENDCLRVEVLPSLGGRIWTLEHRRLRRQFLWHHPRHRLSPLPLGSNYDDNFLGGFDELLPNDIPETVAGTTLADHGELWTTPLKVQVAEDELILRGQLPVTPVSYVKRLWIEGSILAIDYTLVNTGSQPLDLLWKLHPALRISPGAEIQVPARLARVADPAWSRFAAQPEFPWAQTPEARVVPPLTGGTEFLYLLDLTRGQCALGHREENWHFQMTFPHQVFPSVWLFASFGGWRDLEVLILEPCTNPQLSLIESAKAGTCLHLAPGQPRCAHVEVEVGEYREMDPI